MFVKRPKRNEAEEDLLKFQEDFLSKRQSPSATITRVERHSVEPAHVAAATAAHPCDVQMHATESAVNLDQYKGARSTVVTSDVPNIEIIEKSVMKGKVVERTGQSFSVPCDFQVGAVPFPHASRRKEIKEPSASSEKGYKKRSIFARHMEATTNATKMQYNMQTKRAHTVLEDADWRQISADNDAYLDSMDIADITTEQKKLRDSLDPALYEFLKNRGASGSPRSGQHHGITVSAAASTASATAPVQSNTGLITQLASGMAANMETQAESTKVLVGQETVVDMSVSTSMDVQHPGQSSLTSETATMEDLPLHVNPEWLHMDTVECPKLEWMKSINAPGTGDVSKMAARFDFSGSVVDPSADVPFHMGLHHHGSEPERGGYTLEELFILGRSTNIQQRALALQTLANIIKNDKRSILAPLLQAASVLPPMLDAGLLLLLRSALDHASEGVMTAAVTAFHALLIEESDEALLKISRTWSCDVPCYAVVSGHCQTTSAVDESDSSVEEPSSQDVVKAVLKMNLLPRLRYLLEVWKPQPATVNRILEVMVRLAQTSRQVAYEVYRCPRLLACVLEEFVPLTWEAAAESGAVSSALPAYGSPMPAALRLLRIICSSSSSLASSLVAEPQLALVQRLSRVAVLGATDLQLPLAVARDVAVEALLAWRACAGHGVILDAVLDVYPAFMDKLRDRASSDQSVDTDEYLAAIVALLDTAVRAGIRARTKLTSKPRVRFAETVGAGDGSGNRAQEWAQPCFTTWSRALAGLLEPLETLLKQLAREFMRRYLTDSYIPQPLISVMNFFVSYFSAVADWPDQFVGDWQQLGERIAESVLLPLLTSFCVRKLYRQISTMGDSVLTAASQDSIHPCSGLPRLSRPAVGNEEKLGAVGTLTCLLRLVHAVCQAHRGLAQRVTTAALGSDDPLAYAAGTFRRIISGQLASRSGHFARQECAIAFYLCLLASRSAVEVQPAAVGWHFKDYHKLGLALITCLTQGESNLAAELLSSTAFCFQPELSEALGSRLQAVSLEDVALQDRQQEHDAMLKDCMACLPSIRQCYLASLNLEELGTCRRAAGTDSFFVTACAAEPLAPVDWPYLPIVLHYDMSTEAAEHHRSGSTSAVRGALHWVWLLENYYPAITASTSVAAKLARLTCVFLIDCDLFLEHSVQTLLSNLLQLLFTRTSLLNLNLRLPVAGLASFYDLYCSLLDQYSASSFGDCTFSNYVMVPLVQSQDPCFRKAFWGGHTPSARITMLRVRELLVPVEALLEPQETDTEVLNLYWIALLTKTVRPVRNELLYLVAVHHLNRLIYTCDGAVHPLEATRRAVFREVVRCSEAELVHDLLYYKDYCSSSPRCFDCYSDLPLSRQKAIDAASVV